MSLLLVVPPFAVAQESRSSQLATELAALLDAAGLDSIAAKVDGDECAAALYFSGSQLLAVKARSAAPDGVDAQVAERDYRSVYIDLNSASIPDSITLVSDAGADGLQARRSANAPPDTVDIGGSSYVFDGDWGSAGLSAPEYLEAFRMSDVEYTRMLDALIAQARAVSPQLKWWVQRSVLGDTSALDRWVHRRNRA